MVAPSGGIWDGPRRIRSIAVIASSNRVLTHEGHEYHIQAEDRGETEAAFEVRVYEGGTVLWRRRMSYADLVARSLGREAFEEELRGQMEKAVHTLEAAVVRGRIA
jgi:hypothetical protein